MGYTDRMNEPSFFDRVLARLRAVPYADLQGVADATRVSISNLRKIRYGEVRNPGVQTVQALHSYFEALEHSNSAGEGAKDGMSHDKGAPPSEFSG